MSLTITRNPYITIKAGNNPEIVLSETQAKELFIKLREFVDVDVEPEKPARKPSGEPAKTHLEEKLASLHHVKVPDEPAKTPLEEKFCVLAYCELHQEWARSCSGYRDTIAYGTRRPVGNVCPNCKKRVLVEPRFHL